MSTILYIGGVGRSGTTLLERTLATAPGLVALGEVVHLWERSVRDGEPCGCGAEFGDCPFWREVGRRAYGGWEQVDLDSLAADRRRVDRNRFIPLLIAPRFAPRRFREARRRLIETLDRLYSAIGEVSAERGKDVVLIDSSKHPSYVYLLNALPNHDVRLLHVVRDPRGVAHSSRKRVVRPESGTMEQLGTLRVCGRWIAHNLLLHLATVVGIPRLRLPYERFSRDPAEVGESAGRLLGVPSSSEVAGQLALRDGTVTLGVDHTVSGNPMRFRRGELSIRSDEAWRTSMPRHRRLVVSVLTSPLRQIYGR